MRAQFVATGPSSLELFAGNVAGFPDCEIPRETGPGLHHITLRVDDIRAALKQLRKRNVRLIDDEPRVGAEGASVAFIHPSSAHGVLWS